MCLLLSRFYRLLVLFYFFLRVDCDPHDDQLILLFHDAPALLRTVNILMQHDTNACLKCNGTQNIDKLTSDQERSAISKRLARCPLPTLFLIGTFLLTLLFVGMVKGGI